MEVKENLKVQIADNQILQAIKKLRGKLKSSSAINQLTIFEYQLNSIRRNETKGILSPADLNLNCSSLLSRILQFIDDLDSNDVKADIDSQINNFDAHSERKLVKLVVHSTIPAENEEELKEIIDRIMSIGEDYSIEMKQIRRGSTEFLFEVSNRGFQRLLEKFKSGQLEKEIGVGKITFLSELSSYGSEGYEGDNARSDFVDKIRSAIAKKYPSLNYEQTNEIIEKLGYAISELISIEENALAFVKFDESGNPIEITTIDIDQQKSGNLLIEEMRHDQGKGKGDEQAEQK